jgi:GTPase SAR1 family protein
MSDIKIAFVGDEDSGKTSLLRRYQDKQFSENKFSRVGNGSKGLSINGNNVSITDMEGENPREGMVSGVSLAILKPRAIVINIALPTVEKEFDLEEYFEKIKNDIINWRDLCRQSSNKASLLVALNKSDQLSEEKIAALKPLFDKLAKDIDIKSITITSALANTGVDELFYEITGDAIDSNLEKIPYAPFYQADDEVKKTSVLMGAAKFLAGLIVVGLIVGVVLLFVFPPAGLATLLATTVAGGVTVGMAAAIGISAVALISITVGIAVGFFKRKKLNMTSELSDLDLELASGDPIPVSKVEPPLSVSEIIGGHTRTHVTDYHDGKQPPLAKDIDVLNPGLPANLDRPELKK